MSNAAYEGEMTSSVRELKKISIFEIPPRAFVRCIRSMLLPPLFLRGFMRPPVFGERANSQLNVGLTAARSMNRIPWDRNGHSLAAFHAIAYERLREREKRKGFTLPFCIALPQNQNAKIHSLAQSHTLLTSLHFHSLAVKNDGQGGFHNITSAQKFGRCCQDKHYYRNLGTHSMLLSESM